MIVQTQRKSADVPISRGDDDGDRTDKTGREIYEEMSEHAHSMVSISPFLNRKIQQAVFIQMDEVSFLALFSFQASAH